ncbi:hypothetical protein ACWF94_39875, partial [Streptomyces sp. NPDC055078]
MVHGVGTEGAGLPFGAVHRTSLPGRSKGDLPRGTRHLDGDSPAYGNRSTGVRRPARKSTRAVLMS